jgi:hypothetical protein
MDNMEKIYDEQISPLMQQIIDICKEHKIPMFAEVQFGPEDFCKTVLVWPGSHPIMTHLSALSQCDCEGGVNIDKYMMWVSKSARLEGHSSFFLKMAGVPEVGEKGVVVPGAGSFAITVSKPQDKFPVVEVPG